jgi:CRP-like cAMP-binding protein
MIDIPFLSNVEILQGLNHEQLTEILKHCQEVEFQPGAKLFKQGEDAVYLWIVREGRVDLRFDSAASPSSKEHTISTIAEAGAFGWSSFTSPNKYRLSGYCVDSTCKLIRIEREALKRLFEDDPNIGYVVISNIAAIVGTRFHEFQEEAARQRGQDLLAGW